MLYSHFQILLYFLIIISRKINCEYFNDDSLVLTNKKIVTTFVYYYLMYKMLFVNVFFYFWVFKMLFSLKNDRVLNDTDSNIFCASLNPIDIIDLWAGLDQSPTK